MSAISSVMQWFRQFGTVVIYFDPTCPYVVDFMKNGSFIKRFTEAEWAVVEQEAEEHSDQAANEYVMQYLNVQLGENAAYKLLINGSLVFGHH
jgi:hypothetical protein